MRWTRWHDRVLIAFFLALLVSSLWNDIQGPRPTIGESALSVIVVWIFLEVTFLIVRMVGGRVSLKGFHFWLMGTSVLTGVLGYALPRLWPLIKFG